MLKPLLANDHLSKLLTAAPPPPSLSTPAQLEPGGADEKKQSVFSLILG